MIRLTSASQALALRGTIPELAVIRMVQFEGTDGIYDPQEHGHIVVLEEGDDIADLPELSPSGLIQAFDEEWPIHEYIDAFAHGDGLTYELVVQIDDGRTVAVVIDDRPWLDPRLRIFLEQETQANSPAPLPPLTGDADSGQP